MEGGGEMTSAYIEEELQGQVKLAARRFCGITASIGEDSFPKSFLRTDHLSVGVNTVDRAAQILRIGDRRCVVRALNPWPSLPRGTRRRRVRLAEIGEIRAHQVRIGRHSIAECRVRDQRENHVHHVVAEAAAVEGGNAE
jgi:hypothetical protein